MFDGSDSYELTGLGRGGEQINKVKKSTKRSCVCWSKLPGFLSFQSYFYFLGF